jgi:hypothetical protein
MPDESFDQQKVRIVVKPFDVLLIESQLVEVQKVREAMINEFDFGFDVRRQRGLDSLDEGPVANIRRVRGNMDDRFHMRTFEKIT